MTYQRKTNPVSLRKRSHPARARECPSWPCRTRGELDTGFHRTNRRAHASCCARQRKACCRTRKCRKARLHRPFRHPHRPLRGQRLHQKRHRLPRSRACRPSPRCQRPQPRSSHPHEGRWHRQDYRLRPCLRGSRLFPLTRLGIGRSLPPNFQRKRRQRLFPHLQEPPQPRQRRCSTATWTSTLPMSKSLTHGKLIEGFE